LVAGSNPVARSNLFSVNRLAVSELTASEQHQYGRSQEQRTAMNIPRKWPSKVVHENGVRHLTRHPRGADVLPARSQFWFDASQIMKSMVSKLIRWSVLRG
jgi:hypothetical protein